METLDRLHRRIEVSESLKEIVRTMKVLAAATIRQYERATRASLDYGETVELALLGLLRYGTLPKPRMKRGGQIAVVLFGSDHGLCGRFNEVLVEEATPHIKGSVLLLAVGTRIANVLEAEGFSIEECFFVPGSVEGITLTVREILEKIAHWRGRGITTVDLFYNRPEGRGRFSPVRIRLLPIESALFERFQKQRWPGRAFPLFRTSSRELFAMLLRQYLFVSLHRALAESLASEQGQRLLAMQRAEKNIGERLEELRRAYHQIRQEQITSEVLEVVAGFEVASQQKEGKR